MWFIVTVVLGVGAYLAVAALDSMTLALILVIAAGMSLAAYVSTRKR